MFSKAGFGLLKQRALQGLQQNLEQVGFHSDKLESSVLKSDDPKITKLTTTIHLLEESLKGLRKASEEFSTALTSLQRFNMTGSNAVKLMVNEGEELYEDADELGKLFESDPLVLDLEQKVLNPINSHLTLLADLKSRLKQLGILRLEVTQHSDNVHHLAQKYPGSQKLSQAEDKLAAKQVLFDQLNVSLYQELEKLRENKYEILYKIYLAFKTCQYNYFMSSTAKLQIRCADIELPTVSDEDMYNETVDTIEEKEYCVQSPIKNKQIVLDEEVVHENEVDKVFCEAIQSTPNVDALVQNMPEKTMSYNKSEAKKETNKDTDSEVIENNDLKEDPNTDAGFDLLSEVSVNTKEEEELLLSSAPSSPLSNEINLENVIESPTKAIEKEITLESAEAHNTSELSTSFTKDRVELETDTLQDDSIDRVMESSNKVADDDIVVEGDDKVAEDDTMVGDNNVVVANNVVEDDSMVEDRDNGAEDDNVVEEENVVEDDENISQDYKVVERDDRKQMHESKDESITTRIEELDLDEAENFLNMDSPIE